MTNINLDLLYKNKNLLLSDGENVAFSYGDCFFAGKAVVVGSQLSIEEPALTISTHGKPDYQIAGQRIATLNIELRFSNQYEIKTIDMACTQEQLATEFFMKNASVDSLLRVIYKKMEERSGEV